MTIYTIIKLLAPYISSYLGGLCGHNYFLSGHGTSLACFPSDSFGGSGNALNGVKRHWVSRWQYISFFCVSSLHTRSLLLWGCFSHWRESFCGACSTFWSCLTSLSSWWVLPLPPSSDVKMMTDGILVERDVYYGS